MANIDCRDVFTSRVRVVQSSCDSGVMESASGAVAVSSNEQIELEVEGSTANDDQTSLYAEDDSHNREEST